MNMYTDKMPKSCKDCPCMNDDGFGGYDCNLYYQENKKILDCADYRENKRPEECPLKELSSYHKELCEEVRRIAKDLSRPTTEYDDGTFDHDIDAFALDYSIEALGNKDYEMLSILKGEKDDN